MAKLTSNRPLAYSTPVQSGLMADELHHDGDGAGHVDAGAGADHEQGRVRRSVAARRKGSTLSAQDHAFVANLIDGDTLIDQGTRLPLRIVQRYIRLQQRDEIVRLAVAKFCSELYSERAQAKKFADALSRYHNSAWRRDDSSCTTCPARHAGKLEGLLWEILRFGDTPLSVERIRKIVGHVT